MRDEILCEIEVCQDCLMLHANGEYSPDRPADLPEPLALLRTGESLTMGGTHAETCTEADREEDCDCGERGFSTSRCEGCGDWHHGDRYVMTLWRITRETMVARVHLALDQTRGETNRRLRMLALADAATYRRALAELY